MTVAVPSEPTLTENEARELTAQILGQLDASWQLIIRAYEGRAWLAMGYESWDAYCKAEFNGARLRLPREERQDVVGSLREAGLSTRAIASATGLGHGTVAREAARVPSGTPELPDEHEARSESVNRGIAHVQRERQSEREERKVVGLDGKTYTPKPHVTDLISGDELAELNGKPKQDEPIDAEIVDEPAPKPRRKPIADQARSAGWDIRKATERIERLAEDDRFGRNKKEVAAHLRGHLEHVVEVCQDLLNRLDDKENL